MPVWEAVGPNGEGMAAVLAEVTGLMREHRREGAFLIFSRAQRAYVDLLGPAPPGSLATLERMVRRSSRFRLVYDNRDARIWTLRAGGAPSA